jgi:hypothetical protein
MTGNECADGMVHDGPERRRPGNQYSGWALGQSREARRTFLVQILLLDTGCAIHVLLTCHHPFRGHSQIPPTTPATRQQLKIAKLAPFSYLLGIA